MFPLQMNAGGRVDMDVDQRRPCANTPPNLGETSQQQECTSQQPAWQPNLLLSTQTSGSRVSHYL